MANYTVKAEDLTENQIVLIRGKLGFARLTRLIEGEELVKADQRKVQNNMNPVGQPHTTVTVTEAEVIQKDPNSATTEETFVAERRYVPKKSANQSLHYSLDSKGTSLPVIAVPNDDGKYTQDDSGRELAAGLDVTLVVRTYKPKAWNKRGLSLDQVLVNEPVRYYNGGGTDTDELAARGIVFATPPQAINASSAVGEAAPIQNPEETGTVVDDHGLAFPSAAPVQNQPGTAQSPSAVAAPTGQSPADQAAPSATQAPAGNQQMSTEEELAWYRAQNAQLQNNLSAVAAPTNPTGAGDDPWAAAPQQPASGITYPA